jgi:hypothetical protein
MKCQYCDFVSENKDIMMAKQNLEAHYFYLHDKTITQAEELTND